MTKTVKIFDTTLRDGEQSPGCSMNLAEKLQVAERLELLKVDVIEAGFAAASRGDFEAIEAIAGRVKECTVAALARALPIDIETAWEALKKAARPRIHTFLAISDIHMRHKLKKTPGQILAAIEDMVRLARRHAPEVEFSPEDATRARPEFLLQAVAAAVRAGATVINIPDTVGYTTPEEISGLFRRIREEVPGIDGVELSVHCHNDLGMAVANTLAALRAGANQLECTINGIGERAGNAALEEVVMAIKTRTDLFSVDCRVDTTQIYRACRLVSSLIGFPLPPNKAIVGANAFAHESGIHQHGVLSEKSTYEIMSPAAVGLSNNRIVLGKHSGRHAFEDWLRKLGHRLRAEEIDRVFAQFKDLADKKRAVSDWDIEALIQSKSLDETPGYRLDRFVINSGNAITATASIRLSRGRETREEVAKGDGPMDASFKAVEKIVGFPLELEDYVVHSVTAGHDAQGEVVVKVRRTGGLVIGRGLSTDIVEAGIKAYINAANKILARESEGDKRPDEEQPHDEKRPHF